MSEDRMFSQRLEMAQAIKASGFVPDERGAPSRPGPGREASRNALALVKAERGRQDALWGEQNHEPEVWLRILMEEVGEVAKAINDADFPGYRKELIQVAAVAVAAFECLVRWD